MHTFPDLVAEDIAVLSLCELGGSILNWIEINVILEIRLPAELLIRRQFSSNSYYIDLKCSLLTGLTPVKNLGKLSSNKRPRAKQENI